MREPLPFKRAEELMDAEFLAKWMDRQAISPLARRVLGAVLRWFASEGTAPSAEDLGGLLGALEPEPVRQALAELDGKDLLLLREDRVVLAYPFAATPTGFVAALADGGERHACCAIDALGVPALLQEPVLIRSRCHHCREPLALQVAADGPVADDGVMVWVGERGDLRERACASL